jgi:hypothetical protein
MSDALRVVLEIGPKGRRVVAGATDWPGFDRWGKDEEGALANLDSYRPRYAAVAERAGMEDAFAREERTDVVGRYGGNTSTDWWGIAHVPSEIEREVLAPDELERRLSLLNACWRYFDEVAGRVSAELRPGRGAAAGRGTRSSATSTSTRPSSSRARSGCGRRARSC